MIDSSAERFETIMVSAGKRGLQVELAPADLIAQCRAKVADDRGGLTQVGQMGWPGAGPD